MLMPPLNKASPLLLYSCVITPVIQYPTNNLLYTQRCVYPSNYLLYTVLYPVLTCCTLSISHSVVTLTFTCHGVVTLDLPRGCRYLYIACHRYLYIACHRYPCKPCHRDRNLHSHPVTVWQFGTWCFCPVLEYLLPWDQGGFSTTTLSDCSRVSPWHMLCVCVCGALLLVFLSRWCILLFCHILRGSFRCCWSRSRFDFI